MSRKPKFVSVSVGTAHVIAIAACLHCATEQTIKEPTRALFDIALAGFYARHGDMCSTGRKKKTCPESCPCRVTREKPVDLQTVIAGTQDKVDRGPGNTWGRA